ncbi:hypothetical protein [Stenotrophomonas indicatrix]|uniref:hypothetical protein n=1 Tax=Stenotrophomonas indicatrix TaxID=2045451 RepID=UPI0028A89DCB|nr:hypothetical protein [Stenotrophomonas indicatrix]
MSNKHTPGPWAYQEDSDAYTHIVRGPSNRFICQLNQSTSAEIEANTRLIAAAPELLEVSKELVRALELAYGIEDGYSDDRIYDELPSGSIATAFISARAAIAKATGEGA